MLTIGNGFSWCLTAKCNYFDTKVQYLPAFVLETVLIMLKTAVENIFLKKLWKPPTALHGTVGGLVLHFFSYADFAEGDVFYFAADLDKQSILPVNVDRAGIGTLFAAEQGNITAERGAVVSILFEAISVICRPVFIHPIHLFDEGSGKLFDIHTFPRMLCKGDGCVA